MKKLLHLSDLHFGTEKKHLLELLIKNVKELTPDLIIISGDLTQRAKHDQYLAAAKFLKNISNAPVFCVPGNHDISLYNLFERFLYPYKKYQYYVGPLCQTYQDDQIAIFGFNSVNPFKVMSGYISNKQLQLAVTFFKKTSANIIRIAVMHHNLIRSERHKTLIDAPKIINILAELQINLIISGHIHFACVEQVTSSIVTNQMYVVTAGTPISFRTTAPNSYNLINLDEHKFIVTVYEIFNDKFILKSQKNYFWRAT